MHAGRRLPLPGAVSGRSFRRRAGTDAERSRSDSGGPSGSVEESRPGLERTVPSPPEILDFRECKMRRIVIVFALGLAVLSAPSPARGQNLEAFDVETIVD